MLSKKLLKKLKPKKAAGTDGIPPYVLKGCNRLNPDVIRSGFRACGIFPWNSSALDYSKCLGKEFETEDNLDEHNDLPTLIDPNTTISYKQFCEIVGNDKIKQLCRNNCKTQSDDYQILKQIFSAFTEKSSVEISTKDEQEKILEEEVEFLDTSEVIFDINDIPVIIDDTEIVNIPEMENKTLIVPENEIFNMQGIEEYTNEAESSVTKTVKEDQKTKKPEKSLNISENISVNATNKSIATYLIWPDTPARKGKKQTQKLPFVLTSSDRRKIVKEKMEKKLEEERKKEQRKLERKEKQSIKENQKKIKSSNNKKPKKLAKTFNKSEEKSRQPIEMISTKLKKGVKVHFPIEKYPEKTKKALKVFSPLNHESRSNNTAVFEPPLPEFVKVPTPEFHSHTKSSSSVNNQDNLDIFKHSPTPEANLRLSPKIFSRPH
ncbi:myotubularin-related protein DDB_G0290005-like [Diabrotica virgifera virgifera]|uniref:Uncharacterized protein n=1 Tax=Diabrotica virgifera virgifera TaxID=50390 RepID=A0ABM5JSK7_DIAVI|nr:myotubularin-related protein DDB_G0290005-like [Diabrotica virgifera virgifera]